MFTSNVAAARWIEAIPKEKWAQSFDDGHRFGHMTTNLAEAVNGVLKGARNLPITALVQSTFFRVLDYFVKRGKEAEERIASGHRYSNDLTIALQSNIEKASAFGVRAYDRMNAIFQVQTKFDTRLNKGGNTQIVNLHERTCTCGKFQHLHFPCSHAIAACHTVSIDFHQFVHPVYCMDSLLNAYRGAWFPIPH